MKNDAARFWDFPSAAILFIALLLSAQRLAATGWTENLEAIVVLTMLGSVIGLALGYSRFRVIAVSTLALGYSLILIPWIIGLALYMDTLWIERLASMAGRLAVSFNLLAGHKPVADPLLFIAIASTGYWVMSLSAGYVLVRRGGFLHVVLPAGIILFIVQLYDNYMPARAVVVAFYLFLSLLLLGRLTYLKKRAYWRQKKFILSAESNLALNGILLSAAVLLVIVAWLIPAPAQSIEAAQDIWQHVTRPWQTAREGIGNVFASLEGGPGGLTYDYYGEELELGQQAVGGSQVLFSVRAPDSQRPSRYYWRVRVYDTYDGGWYARRYGRQAFSPSQSPLEVPHVGGGKVVEFTFDLSQPRLTILFTPPNPVWVSRPVEVTFVRVDGTLVDPIAFSADTYLVAGETYKVQAYVSNPTTRQLRAAGTDYPSWVTNRYLQLPENLPPRIRELAGQLAADKTTPYDKAMAITLYLRRDITYSKTVAPSPPGQDALEWFLFDLKQGYCSYYATAEVVLLRAAGVPARMAVGFAQGELDPRTDQYTIRSLDAHAWPEVYFPGIGWVEFEPTVSQPLITRPSGEAPMPRPLSNRPYLMADGPVEWPQYRDEVPDIGPKAEVVVPERPFPWTQTFAVLLGLAVVAAGGALFWRRQRRAGVVEPLPLLLKEGMERVSLTPPRWLSRWAYLASLKPIARSFEVINQSLCWLKSPPRPSDTPAERAAALATLLPDAAPAIQKLLHLYHETYYGPRLRAPFPARQAAAAVRRLVVRAVLKDKLAALKRKLSFFSR